MRAVHPLAILAATTATAAAILTACASLRGGAPSASYNDEVEQIRVACEARGGMLIPTGRMSGRPAIDNPCRIHNATAIPPR